MSDAQILALQAEIDALKGNVSVDEKSLNQVKLPFF